MCNYPRGHVEDMEDDYGIEDLTDDMGNLLHEQGLGDSDSMDEDHSQPNDKIPDTSAVEATKGKEIQGIPWERLAITRETYRQSRLAQYKNYENIPNSGEAAAKECRQTEKGGMYYEFRQNTRSVKSTILHFQLRNLVWATSKHDVYLVSHYSILHWSALSGVDTELINFHGHVVPTEKHPGSLLEGVSQTQVGTLAVKDNLLVAGGFQGELICKRLDREGISFCCRTSFDNNAITNAVDIFDTSSGAVHFMASSNNSSVRDYDMETFQLCKHFQFDWSVNHTSLSPGGKLAVIVGDDPDGLLIDANSGKTLHSMKGHHDYSFASAWNPDGRTFATGNQDKTCRIWDTRNLSKAVHVLKGQSALHQTGSSCQWQKQRTSCISSTSRVTTTKGKSWISLVRYLGCLSAQTRTCSLSACGIEHMGASSSLAVYITTSCRVLCGKTLWAYRNCFYPVVYNFHFLN